MMQAILDAAVVTLADCYSSREERLRVLAMLEKPKVLRAHLVSEAGRLANQSVRLDSVQANEAVDVDRDREVRGKLFYSTLTPAQVTALEQALKSLNVDPMDLTITLDLPEPERLRKLGDQVRRDLARRDLVEQA